LSSDAAYMFIQKSVISFLKMKTKGFQLQSTKDRKSSTRRARSRVVIWLPIKLDFVLNILIYQVKWNLPARRNDREDK